MGLIDLRKKVGKLATKYPFVKDTTVLVGGTAGAQLMLVMASPLLTRLYSPDDFGALAVFSALLALFSVIACLRYELAVPLPEKDEDAASLVLISVAITFIFSGFLAAGIYLFGDWALSLLGLPSVAPYKMLLPAGVLSVSLYNIFSYWAVRKKEYGLIAYTKLMQAFATVLVQSALFMFGSVSLVVGLVVGQGLGGGRLGKGFFSAAGLRGLSWRSIVREGINFRRFPIFSTWSGLFNVMGLHLPSLLFASFFGPAVAGLYILAQRVLALPVSIIGQAVSKVFLSGAADSYRDGTIGLKVERTHIALVAIAMPPFLLMFLMGESLFGFVFGEKWADAGVMASLMSPWLFLVFVVSPLSVLYEVMNRQHYGLYFQVGLLSTRVAAIFYGANSLGDPIEAVRIFSIGSAGCWILLLWWLVISTGVNVYLVLKAYFASFLFSVACWAPIYLEFSFMDNTPVFGWLLSILLCVFYIWYFSRKLLRV